MYLWISNKFTKNAIIMKKHYWSQEVTKVIFLECFFKRLYVIILVIRFNSIQIQVLYFIITIINCSYVHKEIQLVFILMVNFSILEVGITDLYILMNINLIVLHRYVVMLINVLKICCYVKINIF